jgi:hypothetical protein
MRTHRRPASRAVREPDISTSAKAYPLKGTLFDDLLISAR